MNFMNYNNCFFFLLYGEALLQLLALMLVMQVPTFSDEIANPACLNCQKSVPLTTFNVFTIQCF